MKKILLALSLIGCLLLAATSCTNPDEDQGDGTAPVQTQAQTQVVVVTDGEGNSVTDEQGNDVTEVVTGNSFDIIGVNTESGWGPIKRP